MLSYLCKLTSKSQHPQHRHAVIVLRGGAIVAQGYNVGWNHAEKNALGKLWPSKRRGTVVWSVRVRPDGHIGMAKPCPKCESYLRENGVKVVYYSTNDGTIERLRL